MEPLHIRPLDLFDLPKLKIFADENIGAGYYTFEELKDIHARSQKNGIMCSFVLTNAKKEIYGMRISYPPGQWHHGKGEGLSPHLWTTHIEDTAFFQTVFLHSSAQGHMWGEKLSLMSIEKLKRLGSKAVVAHSWVESPHNSSYKYLSKLGFISLAVYPRYWYNVEYSCTICGKPCVCTAEEMILYLENV